MVPYPGLPHIYHSVHMVYHMFTMFLPQYTYGVVVWYTICLPCFYYGLPHIYHSIHMVQYYGILYAYHIFTWVHL